MKKILIVEDDALMRATLHTHFENAGFEVVEAENGKLGEELYFSEKPDFLLTDVAMPEQNGLEMLAAIHARDPHMSTPTLVLSSSDEMSQVAEALENDVEGYISKNSLDIDSLVATVSKKLNVG
jgi:DNA-binding NarL/FixJ family response regulator